MTDQTEARIVAEIVAWLYARANEVGVVNGDIAGGRALLQAIYAIERGDWRKTDGT